MCGITFFSLIGRSACERAAVEAWLAERRLRHRGPDSGAVSVRDAFAMGFDRLAIVNLEPSGMQPFRLGHWTMVANGEVYNYAALARGLGVESAALRSDVDVILHTAAAAAAAAADGSDGFAAAAAALDGDFAFVAAADAGGFVAARDHVGVRPLFYGTDADGHVAAFASEAKALVGAPGVAQVRVFPPGHFFASGGGSGGFVPFVGCTPGLLGAAAAAPEPGPAAEVVRRLLEAAVRKRLTHSERPVGVLCSGGVDSAIVAAIAAAARARGGPPVRVFTMAYSEGLSEDAFYARRLCERLGLADAHEVVTFGPGDVAAAVEPVVAACETYDPNTVRAAIPMYLLARHIATKTDVRVVLSGEGADELFAGYNYFRHAPDAAAAQAEVARLLRNTHMFDLLRADRCFAAHGLEVRVPFLDQALVAYCTAQRPDPAAPEKALLRRAFEHDDPLRELRIIDRPKERFSDGCGFSYVPRLLNLLSGDAPTLDRKLAAEKAAHDEAFARLYGAQNRGWVVDRQLPDWPALRDRQAQGATACALG
jgi:asparagine synthase (glutamine-hydrolysing)